MLKQGHPELALPLVEQSLAIQQSRLPPDHADIATALLMVGKVYKVLNRREEATIALKNGASVQRRSQFRCAGPGCTLFVRLDGAPLDVCVNCRRTFYCGKACQTADWKREGGHRAECKKLIAEGKAAESSGGET